MTRDDLVTDPNLVEMASRAARNVFPADKEAQVKAYRIIFDVLADAYIYGNRSQQRTASLRNLMVGLSPRSMQ